MKDHEDIRGLQLTLGLYVVIFAMKVDALMEPLLGSGICEVHVDPWEQRR